MSKETILPPSIDKAIENISSPITQNIGQTFGDIWYLVFSPISQMVEKRRLEYSQNIESFKNQLNSKIQNISEENRIEPSIQITAQALENSKYCIGEPELRDMFSSLIANSMDKEKLKNIHPSFAEVIKQMSPLDAKIIKLLKNSSRSGFPICNYCLRNKENGYFVLAERIFLELPQFDTFLCSQSLTVLERLGLVFIPPNVYLNNEDIYKKFEEHPLYLEAKKMYPNHTIEINKGKVCLTNLGLSFVQTCIPD